MYVLKDFARRCDGFGPRLPRTTKTDSFILKLHPGHRGLEPRARSQSSAADRLSDSSVHARSSTTQNNPSANCWSSSEARSTSVSSAENVIASSSRSSDGADRLNGQQSPSTRTPRQNESIRWSPECDDSEEEVERIRVYKQNRRKRYMAYLHERTGGESSPQKSFYA